MVYYIANLWFFGTPFIILLYYLRSSIFCLFSGDKYLSFDVSLSNLIFYVSFATVSEVFCREVFKTFVILSAISLSIKSSVNLAGFWIALVEPVLSSSVADCLDDQ